MRKIQLIKHFSFRLACSLNNVLDSLDIYASFVSDFTIFEHMRIIFVFSHSFLELGKKGKNRV